VRRTDQDPVILGDLRRDHLLEPLRIPGATAAYSQVRSADPWSKARILYGPPGSGTTTYVRMVARYRGWPSVVLDPSVFAEEGPPLIATVASRIFSKLVERRRR
jgi:hypothetical protein